MINANIYKREISYELIFCKFIPIFELLNEFIMVPKVEVPFTPFQVKEECLLLDSIEAS